MKQLNFCVIFSRRRLSSETAHWYVSPLRYDTNRHLATLVKVGQKMAGIDPETHVAEIEAAASHPPLLPPLIPSITTGTSFANVWGALNRFSIDQGFVFALYRSRGSNNGSDPFVRKIMRCCRPDCTYKVDIRDYGGGRADLVYDSSSRNEHNHKTDGSDVTEGVSALIDKVERGRQKKNPDFEDENLPPGTVQNSKLHLWKMINDWAKKDGFVFRYKSIGGKKKNNKQYLRFVCCRSGEDGQACGYNISVTKHGDTNWTVNQTRNLSVHNHSLCPIDQLSRDQRNLIYDIEKRILQLDPQYCPDYLPAKRSFRHREDLERYLNDFSLNYKSDGVPFYFGWVKKDTNTSKSGADSGGTPTETITYACSRYRKPTKLRPCVGTECPVKVNVYKDVDGVWHLRHAPYQDNVTGHNHAPADSKWSVMVHRRLSSEERQYIKESTEQGMTPTQIAQVLKQRGNEAITNRRVSGLIFEMKRTAARKKRKLDSKDLRHDDNDAERPNYVE